MACDEGVIRATHAPRAYATCLTRLAERGLKYRSEALSLGAWHRRPELARRIHSILRRRSTLTPTAARAFLLAVVGILLFGSLELSRVPQPVAFVSPQSSSAPAPAHPLSMPASASTMDRPWSPASGQPATPPRMVNVKASLPASSQLDPTALHRSSSSVVLPLARRHAPHIVYTSAKLAQTSTAGRILSAAPGAMVRPDNLVGSVCVCFWQRL